MAGFLRVCPVSPYTAQTSRGVSSAGSSPLEEDLVLGFACAALGAHEAQQRASSCGRVGKGPGMWAEH